jgi:cysteinyl-tRNA synthetase
MKLYNTLSRKKETFIPQEENKVSMYVCGPTVYNYFHIGNARVFIMFDILRRYFEHKGFEVNYVQNFTDVDDKIITKANEEGVDALEVSERFIVEYFKDADALGVKRASVHPKVSDNISQIIDFIDELVKKGNAYEIDGDVYFDTTSFNDYGKLSGQSIEDLNVGSRIDVDERKKNPTDFALWKKKKPREIAWQSPWSEGRPGWHIECSVMSYRYIGPTIDIHAGGQDLIFPHHENEIAQSEAHNNVPFVRYWLHNGYINIENEKMSKSKNNFFTARDVLSEYDSEVIRFFMLSAHYRSPINFSRELVESSAKALERLYNLKNSLEFLIEKSLNNPITEEEKASINRLEDLKTKFYDGMDDDFNTADALGAIFEIVREINQSKNENSTKEYLEESLKLFMKLVNIFGILNKSKDSLEDEVEKLIIERQEARTNKNFKRSDEIRDLLKEKGIKLEDTPSGVKWSKIN